MMSPNGLPKLLNLKSRPALGNGAAEDVPADSQDLGLQRSAMRLAPFRPEKVPATLEVLIPLTLARRLAPFRAPVARSAGSTSAAAPLSTSGKWNFAVR